mgnify:CR=1 FL=1
MPEEQLAKIFGADLVEKVSDAQKVSAEKSVESSESEVEESEVEEIEESESDKESDENHVVENLSQKSSTEDEDRSEDEPQDAVFSIGPTRFLYNFGPWVTRRKN